jgi:hypothetical protein
MGAVAEEVSLQAAHERRSSERLFFIRSGAGASQQQTKNPGVPGFLHAGDKDYLTTAIWLRLPPL